MSRFLVVILVLAALLFPLTAAAGTVPNAADSIAEQLDEQLMMRYAGDDPGMTKKQRQALARARIMILGTTPADINNLEAASPLARQMTEEISRWLINAGYRYQELRKGSYIRFDRRTGELILTREVRKHLCGQRQTGALQHEPDSRHQQRSACQGHGHRAHHRRPAALAGGYARGQRQSAHRLHPLAVNESASACFRRALRLYKPRLRPVR